MIAHMTTRAQSDATWCYRATSRNTMTFIRSFAISVILVFPLGTLALGDDGPDENPTLEQTETDKLWSHLTERLATYSWSSDDSGAQTFQLKSEPLLRYTDPVREFLGGGQLHLILDGELPVAACSIWLNVSTAATVREFATLSGESLVCRNANGNVVWRPQPAESLHVPLPRAGEPAATARRRLGQMRNCARRFTATFFRRKDGEPFELRLLPQPVYRFADASPGITDAAMFAFVESNDPDLLLTIAARTDSDSGESVWTYSLARMNSGHVQVRLDDAELHEYRDIRMGPCGPEDQYVEADDMRYPAP